MMKEEPRLDMCLYKVAEQILLPSCQLAPPPLSTAQLYQALANLLRPLPANQISY